MEENENKTIDETVSSPVEPRWEVLSVIVIAVNIFLLKESDFQAVLWAGSTARSGILSVQGTTVNPASLEAPIIKTLPTMQETQVQSLGRDDPLEEEMATHSSILAWRIL